MNESYKSFALSAEVWHAIILLKTYSKIDTRNLELARGCPYFRINVEVNHWILQNFNRTEHTFYATHQNLLRMPKFLV